MFPPPQNADRPLSNVERAVHLLNRAAYGSRPGDVARVLSMGFAGYLDEQLHPEAIDDSTVDAREAAFITRRMAPPDLKPTAVIGPGAATSAAILPELRTHKLLRAIHSRRQLQEVLVDFWFNHFNVFFSKGDCRYLTTGYERDAIRPNVLSAFKDILLAVAKHPAMLVYLDNSLSTASGINENYARELMELHTLGVDGGYTQQDIVEVSRCFTGWTVDRQTLQFYFDEGKHASGSKMVLGHTIASGGREEGEAVIALLAAHPSTAKMLATKLVRRFVSDDPPASLVARTSKAFSDTGGDLRKTVRSILTSEEFFAASAFRSKLKSPFEFVVSAVRALDAELRVPPATPPMSVTLMLEALRYSMAKVGRTAIAPEIQAYMSLAQQMEFMGQVSYQYEAPTGFPDRGDYWLSAVSVLHRLNFAIALANNQLPDVAVDMAAVEQRGNASNAAWDKAVAAVFGDPNTRFLRAVPRDGRDGGELTGYVAILLGSPEFQHR
jgi:uncharacterized protein (DUF1800 family)